MSRFCVNCGSQLNETAKHCSICGAQNTPQPVAPPQQPAVTEQPAVTSPYAVQPQPYTAHYTEQPQHYSQQPPQPQQQPSQPQQPQPHAAQPQPYAAQPQPYAAQPQPYAAQPQPYPYPQQQQPYPPRTKPNKKLIIILAASAVAVALALTLIFTNVFGLVGAKNDPNVDNNGRNNNQHASDDPNSVSSSSNGDTISTYEVFGDGKLISAPERLKAAASPDDGISTEALVGEWQVVRSSINTEYGFADDGWFYKNTMITHSHLNSIYHSGYYSGDYYYYGWWENNWSYTYTYLDTLVGEYKVKGGVIEFFHIVAINRTTFEDDWHRKDTRSVSVESLQSSATSAKMHDDFHVEFEFINKDRIRFRDENDDHDLFWHLRDIEHNVQIPKHEIPPVEWPERALSPDMPEISTNGRYREASLSYTGKDKNIPAEYKTVTVVIDKAPALADIDAYGRKLRNSGWWVEDYELTEESSYLSLDARKGMFKLSISNGRGSGTSADTIVIESTKYQEGSWPKDWTDATLIAPSNSVIVGLLDIETGVDKNIYETIIFDKVNDDGVNSYKSKLIEAGFKKPQYSSDDWDFMKYVRLGKELYLARIKISKRMDSLTSFLYDLSYVEDGVWPATWTQAGLFPPEGYDTIAGAIDKEYWDKSMSEYSYESMYIKYLNLDSSEIAAYFSKLKSSGFKHVKDYDGNDREELYNFLRIEGRMIRVEIYAVENDDISEIKYEFNCYEDGEWPSIWQSGGFPAPDKYETIVGAIDLDRWREDLSGDYNTYTSLTIKYLGMTATDATNYIAKLKNAGFKAVKDWEGKDADEYYNFLRIDGKLLRVEMHQRENWELTEYYYSFRYYEDGAWPTVWQSGGFPMPDGNVIIVGAIDLDRWREDLSGGYNDYTSLTIKYLGMTATDVTNYIAKLKNAGFKPKKDWEGKDTDEYYNYMRIDGKLLRVDAYQRENYELAEFYYSFRYSEDGEWPSAWTAAGIPAPTYTAMYGAIDMEEFNSDISNGWIYSTTIKLVGANLSAYASTLRSNGFTDPDYDYDDDYWQLKKMIKINGALHEVSIENRQNEEIPEIYIVFRNKED